MNRIRVLVQVIVMVGILTGCDSCDDGMDYPIVEYSEGITASQVNQANLEEIRLLFKTSHPDIKVIEVKSGGTNERVGNRIRINAGLVESWTSTGGQAKIDSWYNNIFTQLFGAPAGLLAMADSTAATADSTAASADDPAA